MEPDPNEQRHAGRILVSSDRRLDGDGRLDRRSGRVERREDTVTGRLDDLAATLADEGPEHLVVPADERLPAAVAQTLRDSRRIDDVREHERLPDDPRP
jgi:hypothetical protein